MAVLAPSLKNTRTEISDRFPIVEQSMAKETQARVQGDNTLAQAVESFTKQLQVSAEIFSTWLIG